MSNAKKEPTQEQKDAAIERAAGMVKKVYDGISTTGEAGRKDWANNQKKADLIVATYLTVQDYISETSFTAKAGIPGGSLSKLLRERNIDSKHDIRGGKNTEKPNKLFGRKEETPVEPKIEAPMEEPLAQPLVRTEGDQLPPKKVETVEPVAAAPSKKTDDEELEELIRQEENEKNKTLVSSVSAEPIEEPKNSSFETLQTEILQLLKLLLRKIFLKEEVKNLMIL